MKTFKVERITLLRLLFFRWPVTNIMKTERKGKYRPLFAILSAEIFDHDIDKTSTKNLRIVNK